MQEQEALEARLEEEAAFITLRKEVQVPIDKRSDEEDAAASAT